LIGAEHLAAGNAKQKAVANLACSAGYGNTNGGLGHDVLLLGSGGLVGSGEGAVANLPQQAISPRCTIDEFKIKIEALSMDIFYLI
jgi:hypothetical protein